MHFTHLPKNGNIEIYRYIDIYLSEMVYSEMTSLIMSNLSPATSDVVL